MEMSERRVMVIGAHPDDADILTGLTTRRASHADFGDDVVLWGREWNQSR